VKLPTHLLKKRNLFYVGVDFNHQSLKQELLKADFDPNKSTVFTLEGVSQYISKKALDSTLRDIAELSQNNHTVLYLSYANSNLISNPKVCVGKGYAQPEKKIRTILKLAAKVGEPWISLYTPDEVKDLLARHGFTIREDKTLADFNDVYFADRGRALPRNELFNVEHSVFAARI
jgi:O-methyltransferase involved in polyketide biosynthesis